MTSIPSPFDALRALLPLPGRGGPDGGPFGPLGDLPDLDDGPPRGPGQHARHGDGPVGPAAPGGPLRADGQAPLSPSEAHQIADTLTDAMRQNPSHPLFRDLPQTSPEAFRQWVVDVLTSPQSMMHGLTRETVQSLAQATSTAAALLREPGPSPAMAQARAEGDAMRASIQAQAQAQQATAERAQAMPRGDDARIPAALAQQAGDGRMSADPRVASALAQAQAPGLAPGLAQAPRAETVLPPGAFPPQGTPTTPAAQVPGSTVAQGLPAQGPADAARPATESPATLLQARGPEGVLPARAERAGDALPQGGLPGLAGAAGITLAAVAQPAGTTFAHAPQDAVRARTPAERRVERDAAAKEAAAQEQAQARDGDGRQEQRNRKRPAPADGSAEGRPASSAQPGTAPANATATAAGHVALAGASGAAQAADDSDEEIRPGGHLAPGEDTPDGSEADSSPPQWLYWSLIAVTYGCLTGALVLMSPWAASLPVAIDAMPGWRNGLTIAGLASGIWAWLLARRMR